MVGQMVLVGTVVVMRWFDVNGVRDRIRHDKEEI